MNHARGRTVLAVIAVGLFSVAPLRAQESDQKKVIPLKIEVVLNEFDGAKKISSLPYTFYANADERPGNTPRTSIRSGQRVPIYVGPHESSRSTPSGNGAVVIKESDIQYSDIGTNLDCRATSNPDGRYRLELSIERLYIANASLVAKGSGASDISTNTPILGHFSSSYSLFVHDGQATEATSTTDPLSGHVLQVVITATAVK